MRDFANLHADAWPLRLAGRAGLALLFAALMAFLAPFGTYRFEAVERIGYWTVQMAAWLSLSLIAAWCLAQVPAARRWRRAARQIVATLLAAIPMMAVTGAANSLMTGWRPDPGELLELFLSIALIGGCYTVLADWLVAAPPRDAAPSSITTVEEPLAVAPLDTALIDRLPPHLRTGILCLQVEDHYVRVHARDGSSMVLMRFSDAVRGVAHVPGAQVHRSWWVADDAVTELRRTGRTALLTLRNGVSVPVSQPYVAHAIQHWGTLGSSPAQASSAA